MNNPVGERFLGISVGTANLKDLIIALVIMVAAYVMEQGLELEEESLSLNDRERELIIKALEKNRGRRKNASKELGISERTLYRKIKEYDINL
jgi:transcriptional regulator of acetoin/glycerol metabolism